MRTGAIKGTVGHVATKLLISPRCNPLVVWVSGAETSIKTWRLSLNLSLALRRKQPQPEFQSSLTHTYRRSPAGLYRARDRSELVLHLGENQILVHFHQLSVSDRYFCRAGQEIRLLNYSFSQGPRHFALLSYRCSIKVSHCNHLSFPWLNTVFQQAQNAVLFSLVSFVFPLLLLSFSLSLAFCLYLGLICACFGFKHKTNSEGVNRGQRPGHSQSKVDYWLSCRQHSLYIGTSAT